MNIKHLNSAAKAFLTCYWILRVYLDPKLFSHHSRSPLSTLSFAMAQSRNWWYSEFR